MVNITNLHDARNSNFSEKSSENTVKCCFNVKKSIKHQFSEKMTITIEKMRIKIAGVRKYQIFHKLGMKNTKKYG